MQRESPASRPALGGDSCLNGDSFDGDILLGDRELEECGELAADGVRAEGLRAEGEPRAEAGPRAEGFSNMASKSVISSTSGVASIGTRLVPPTGDAIYEILLRRGAIKFCC